LPKLHSPMGLHQFCSDCYTAFAPKKNKTL